MVIETHVATLLIHEQAGPASPSNAALDRPPVVGKAEGWHSQPIDPAR